MKFIWLSVLTCLVFSFLFALPVQADGIIVPEPPIPTTPVCNPGYLCPPLPPRPLAQLVIRNHQVQVVIQDQVAVTRVDQIFYNPNNRPIEGVYLFPLPIGAAVSKFTLWVDGRPVDGKVLDAKEARKLYESIVRKNNDPALLEYAGRGVVQAQIYPIPPRGERRIQLEYQQVLPVENGLIRYVYPLSTEKFSAKPLEFVSIDVKISSKQKIRAIYSPSHPISTQKDSDTQYRAGFETKNVLPTTDFALYFSIGETEAFHVLSYRDPTDGVDPDGYFLMLIAPKPGEPVKKVAKDVLLVIDQSGSMDGEKFKQAQGALRYILRHLDREDRFYVSSFSTGVKVYANGMRSADEAEEAIAWVDKLSAQGSTDINRALLEAVAVVDGSRPAYLIFLTDGLPTTGVIKREDILKNVASAAPKNLRIFPFGIGYDVDTLLLDTLSQNHHGMTAYVQPKQAIDEVVSGFFAAISTPVLTNLQMDFGSLVIYDLYPDPLPDLFVGSQIIAAGRYRKGGITTVTLKGTINDQKQSFQYPNVVLAEKSNGDDIILEQIPRIWATRKVGYLLNQLRLHGNDPETINQIIRLSVRFGIVTPYTSYLVTESNPLGADAQQRLAQEQYRKSQSMPAASPAGQKAVESSQDQGRLAGASQAPVLPQGVEQSIQVAGSRTFIYKNGIWIDTAFDDKKVKPQPIVFLSPEYFDLLDRQPHLAPVFALGKRVIVMTGRDAYEIVDAMHEQGIPTIVATNPTKIIPATTQTPTLKTPTSAPIGARPTTTPGQNTSAEEIPAWWFGAGIVFLIGLSWAVWDIWKMFKRG